MAKKPTSVPDPDEPIPHQWGQSYKAMKQMINPPGRPKASPAPPAPASPSRPPILGRGARADIEKANKRAAAQGTESLLQKEQRTRRK